ncbi:hypothetical protein [Streptomyces sp. URMC 123]|uniref:hypothetical protein n=1 Tax=Streptomyces sp. URMC 123 TaxID=3423403 RepID=UPI003F1C65C7
MEPSDLASYARQVRRAADDAQDALSYVRKFTAISPAETGLLWRPFEMHDGLRDGVTHMLKRLDRILSASANELAASARYYRETDSATAASLDAAYANRGR